VFKPSTQKVSVPGVMITRRVERRMLALHK
jgi:hypothetical protein